MKSSRFHIRNCRTATSGCVSSSRFARDFMSESESGRKRVTLREIARMKREGEKLVVVTAYDVLFARVVDASGVDIVLVGDSVGNVVAGFETTLPVKLDQMIYHGAAVRRGIKRALLVVDMPFLS